MCCGKAAWLVPNTDKFQGHNNPKNITQKILTFMRYDLPAMTLDTNGRRAKPYYMGQEAQTQLVTHYTSNVPR